MIGKTSSNFAEKGKEKSERFLSYLGCVKAQDIFPYHYTGRTDGLDGLAE